MNNIKDILNLISNDFGIFRGNHESETDYEWRLIYSMTGQMGYASLWDNLGTEEGDVSITHFKARINDTLEAYQSVFSEINGKYADEISDEIYNIFFSSGYLYHSNYRIRPCIEKEVHYDGIVLCRGVVPKENVCVSGLGTFYKDNEKKDSIENVLTYLSFNRPILSKYYQLLVKNALFSKAPQMKFEYLRTKKPFTSGYWIDEPDSEGITIARSGMNGNYLYYLMNGEKNQNMYQLPAGMTDGGEYRAIANSIISEKRNLPASKYIVDGAIVRLLIEYLYPNEEMNLIKLYSWPGDYIDKSKDFYRVFSCDVFFVIKKIFEYIGYKFVEEK